MSSALLTGSICLRTLQNNEQFKLTRRSIDTAYAVMDDSNENRQLLQRLSVPFLFSEGTLIIPGEQAGKISRFSNLELLPLIEQGELVLNDPVHRQLLSTLIQSVLPRSRTTGEHCAFITPGSTSTSALSKLVSQLIALQGYKPFATTITLAAGLSSLPAASRFSGYVVYLGHSQSEIGLIHQSRVVARQSTPYGSEWMDEQLAHAYKLLTKNPDGEMVPDLASARDKRLGPEVSLSPYLSSPSAISSWYDSLLDSLLDQFVSQMESIQAYTSTLATLPVIYLGELATVNGLGELLAQHLNSREIQFDAQQVVCIPDAADAIIRGALVIAAMEEESSAQAA